MTTPVRGILLLLALLAGAARSSEAAATSAAAPSSTAATIPAPAGGGSWRASFAEATGNKLAPIPLSFAIPAGYLLRSAGTESSAGCLWGTRADLDRGMAPDGFDFSGIQQGVFRARVSPNVGYDAANKQFSGGPGEPEGSVREQLEKAGAKIVRFARVETSPQPALEMVADLQDKRVYMLFLAMGIDTNVVLINYHPPAQRTAADDLRWRGFVAGIQRASAGQPKP